MKFVMKEPDELRARDWMVLFLLWAVIILIVFIVSGRMDVSSVCGVPITQNPAPGGAER